MTLGERILQKRKECGLSQESLGEKLDVTRQTVYKWESDQAVPELDKLITLARIFGVRVGWLIAEEENDQKEQAYLEAAQKIAALLAQSQAPQPAGSELEAGKAPAGKKINRFQSIVIAALVVTLAVCAFNFASIDRKIASLENTNRSSFQTEDPTEISAGPGQDAQVITTEKGLTVYAFPSEIADLKGTLAPGETVEILRTVPFVEARWCYIQHQLSDGTELSGWVNLGKTELNSAAEEAEASQPGQDTQSITTEKELTVYSAPSTTTRPKGALPAGETVEILRTEHVEDHLWGFMQHQLSDGTELSGWINLDEMELEAKPDSTTAPDSTK